MRIMHFMGGRFMAAAVMVIVPNESRRTVDRSRDLTHS